MQKFAHAHVSKELKAKLGIKRRAIQARRGDTVKIMDGSLKGKTGKISRINLREGSVYIEGITRKNAKAKEIMVPIHASKVYLTDLDLSDKLRKQKLGISG